ncbi:MAG: type VI secretion system baseplate subunit TssE [Acidobacteria bacterium]|nr:type VI secretion system baseplate subunit TssE [Acidobacteriota bacterium]MBI3655363.1 type VI secretion system baseplate subunit TssE [Acidobacteriota bacterium]
MSRATNEIRITPSVLDRLIDYEPEISSESHRSRLRGLRELKQAVKRDLEWLLNTRQPIEPPSAELKELNSSVAVYGLPDFTSLNAKNRTDQNRMRRAVEAAIRVFEPRLVNVAVTLEAMRENERLMRFRIDAHLKVEPAPEPITFDTVLQLDNGQYLVREE